MHSNIQRFNPPVSSKSSENEEVLSEEENRQEISREKNEEIMKKTEEIKKKSEKRVNLKGYYVVEKILDKKQDEEGWKYKIKWMNYPMSQCNNLLKIYGLYCL